MDVRNCARCNVIFRPVGGRRICAKCVEADRAEFDKVREFLRHNPMSNVSEIAQATDVSVKKIQEYVREGRLVAGGTDWGVTCEGCGAAISKGRRCTACAAKLGEELRGKGPAKPPSKVLDRREARTTPATPRDRFRRRS